MVYYKTLSLAHLYFFFMTKKTETEQNILICVYIHCFTCFVSETMRMLIRNGISFHITVITALTVWCINRLFCLLKAEILELAGNAARDNKKGRITPRHIKLAVANDEELNQVCLMYLTDFYITHGSDTVAPLLHRKASLCLNINAI